MHKCSFYAPAWSKNFAPSRTTYECHSATKDSATVCVVAGLLDVVVVAFVAIAVAVAVVGIAAEVTVMSALAE